MIQLVLQSPLLRDPQVFAETVKDSLAAICKLNEATLRAFPNAPRLYTSGVCYGEEPPGEETLVDAAQVYLQAWGDCAHLACIRVAECRVFGGEPEADIIITWLAPEARPRLFHVQVRRGKGTGRSWDGELGKREDPSVILGMARPKLYPPDDDVDLGLTSLDVAARRVRGLRWFELAPRFSTSPHANGNVAGRPPGVSPWAWRSAERVINRSPRRYGWGAVVNVARRLDAARRP